MALLLLARVDQTQKLKNKLEPKRAFDAALSIAWARF